MAREIPYELDKCYERCIEMFCTDWGLCLPNGLKECFEMCNKKYKR